MRITTVFMVTDPCELSVPIDCLSEYDVRRERFADYVCGSRVGAGRGMWSGENTALWTDPVEAIADMEERFKRLRGGIPNGCSLPVVRDGKLVWVTVPK